MYEFNTSNGKLKKTSAVTQSVNPSFLTVSPSGCYLYACTETKLPAEGNLTAFRIDSIGGQLMLINKQKSGGENPVYLTVYKNNRFVVNVNYSSGSISVYNTNEDGSLGPASQLLVFKDSSINKQRQEKAHIHATVFSPDQDYLFAPDLGADKIRGFSFDPGKPTPLREASPITVQSIAGSGPRYFTFHPNGKFAYAWRN